MNKEEIQRRKANAHSSYNYYWAHLEQERKRGRLKYKNLSPEYKTKYIKRQQDYNKTNYVYNYRFWGVPKYGLKGFTETIRWADKQARHDQERNERGLILCANCNHKPFISKRDLSRHICSRHPEIWYKDRR